MSVDGDINGLDEGEVILLEIVENVLCIQWGRGCSSLECGADKSHTLRNDRQDFAR